MFRSRPAMLLWAGAVVPSIAIGIATACLGFAVMLPWPTCAAWRGDREILHADAWPALD